MHKEPYTVSLVGRPNVGKSTLFNRIAGKRRSITFGEPGVTRDAVSVGAAWGARKFRLVDTGGYMTGAEGDLLPKIRAQVLRAIYESDAVIFLVDARDGVLPLDKEITGMLRERGKRFFLAANKVDTRAGRDECDQFHALGVERIYPISSEHGTGVAELLDDVVAKIPEDDAAEGPAEAVIPRIAIVGRPNVGKSTLVNTLVGYERVIASEMPGTTRDAVDVLVTYAGRKYLFIDTAGIRAKRKAETMIERFSVMRSLDSIRRCDLALLMIDGAAGLAHQDQQILRYILDEERAVIVAANKADLWKDEEDRKRGLRAVKEGLGFASFAEIVPTAATSGKGIPLLFRRIEATFGNYRKRIPTALLNKMASAALYAVPIPSKSGSNRAFYITQVGVMPPAFAVFVKDRTAVPESFTRYLQNTIRDRFDFGGCPLRILYREK